MDPLEEFAAAQEALIGQTRRHEIGSISTLMIARYALATGDSNPLYHDPAAARAAGYDDVIAPPNMLSAVVEWGPGLPESELAADGTGRGRSSGLRIMGAGEEIAIDNPLVAGTSVVSETEVVSVERKQGRSGPLVFVTARHDFLTAEGVSLNRNRRTIMART